MASVMISRIGHSWPTLCGHEFRHLQLQAADRSLSIRSQTRITALQSSAHDEKLKVAIEVVERACQLCLSVRSRVKQGEQQLDKVDNTPVTVADFGVQALISLELGRRYPHIPLVGEENASQLRGDYEARRENSLVETIVETLTPLLSGELDCEAVLDAIDRGAEGVSNKQRLYWVLDPIDGTQGFLRGGNALYVVGLALIQDGKPVLAVMGCPNHALHDQRGLIMAAIMAGGCWVKPLTGNGAFIRSEVARHETIADACFCISDREIWSDTLLAKALKDMHGLSHVQSICCGSLCKYLAIALGEVSAFLLPAAPSKALKVWDHAAGILCVSEAGGRVSDLDGTAIDSLVGNGKQVFTVESGGILTTNNALHDHLLTAIRKQTISDWYHDSIKLHKSQLIDCMS